MPNLLTNPNAFCLLLAIGYFPTISKDFYSFVNDDFGFPNLNNNVTIILLSNAENND